MKRDINKFVQNEYDLLIIGGGINGAGLANTAALNGLKVALLEKNDFASGTSSKSTKLLHGGLRYLENFEFDLVREALKERYVHIKSVPHLVAPLAFVVPVYKTDVRPLWLLKLGVFLYDLLSGAYAIGKHQSLTSDEVVKLVPGIKRDDLTGGVLYYDVQMDDARLCLENVLNAVFLGADVANYVEVKSLIKENGKVVGVKAQDLLTQKTFDVRAKKIVSTIGPWTNFFTQDQKEELTQKVRTTKGIHIVHRGRVSQHALLVPTEKDKRIFFIIPWHGYSLIGTTDTDYSKNPDHVGVEEEDVTYLLAEVRRLFPGADFSVENVIMSFAGLRPLVYEKGQPSKVSRKHVIEESSSGIVYVMGGKYTTYRIIAEDTLKFISKKRLISTQHYYPLYGAGLVTEDPAELALDYDLSPQTMELLIKTYGTRYKDVLSLVLSDPLLKERICPCSPVIKAQLVYARDVEMAVKVDDVFMRRLSLGYQACKIGNCRGEINKLFS